MAATKLKMNTSISSSSSYKQLIQTLDITNESEGKKKQSVVRDKSLL